MRLPYAKRGIKKFLKLLMRNSLFDRASGFVCQARKSFFSDRVTPGLQRIFSERIVLNGPFKGMAMPYFSCWAKLIGSYEDELHQVLDDVVAFPYSTVVNIGCAEGYYAVGLAMKLTTAKVHCFDANPWMLEKCRQNAQINRVSQRMTFQGRCDLDRLARLDLSQRSLIVCDVDGFETELLLPQKIADLRKCDLLVEVHDCLAPGTTDALRQRFRDTHEIHELRERWKDVSRYPELKGLSVFEQRVVLSEDRWSEEKPLDQEWLFLQVKTKAAALGDD
jgi:hypothetical protein